MEEKLQPTLHDVTGSHVVPEIDGTEPRMREHLCIKDLQVHDGPVENCCINEWRDEGVAR